MITRQVTVDLVYRKSENIEMMRKHISYVIEEAFSFFKLPLDKGIMTRFVNHQVPTISDEIFVVPAGLYIVADIVPLRRGQTNVLKTYKPAPDQPEMIVQFYSGMCHPTNIEHVRVIRNPADFQ
jgi:hypothetical protein